MPIKNAPYALLSLFIAACFPSSPGAPTQAPEKADCQVNHEGIRHDSFDPSYRFPTGATTPGQKVRLRLRTLQGDVSSARLRLWDDRLNKETWLPMQRESEGKEGYDWWTVTLSTGENPTILYYFFEVTDAGDGACPPDRDFYVDDDTERYGGGTGAAIEEYDDWRSFQITVYDPAFSVPEWLQRGVIYQIFPDRFRPKDPSRQPSTDRFFYNAPEKPLSRSGNAFWNTPVCDPRTKNSPQSCPGVFGQNFYGGDLQGITEKIQEGYFSQLGVTILYLNPIFTSPSNHKYDTTRYLEIDPDFGTLEDFKDLIQAAEKQGIRVILDGVFNHTSSDSPYFDRYSRFDAEGRLTSPKGPGKNDKSGACESPESPFRAWFSLPDRGSPAKENGSPVTCADGLTYEAWFGFSSLPRLRSDAPGVRQLFFSEGTRSVGPYWIAQKASGWRLDVAADVDPGLTRDPENDFWEKFRAAVRDPAVTGSQDAVLIGEEWGDASPWLLGNEWDSTMNYRFRAAVLGWLFTRCQGEGCDKDSFSDNDNHAGSASGPIRYESPSRFHARLLSIWEDYPPMAFRAMMNLVGSHDTNRVLFLLKKINGDDLEAAKRRLKELWIFAFTYPGAPTIYYGDEVGLFAPGVFVDGTWQDDPYNRAPFPWDDTPGHYTADKDLLAHVQKMASIRRGYRALQDGEVHHGLIIDDARKVYGFGRTHGAQVALIALNRDEAPHEVAFEKLDEAPFALPDGAVFFEALSGARYTVQEGRLRVSVPGAWGAVLLLEEQALGSR